MAEVAGTHMVLSNPVLEFESITQVKKFRFFSVIHHQTSRIIKYSSGYNHKQGFSISSAFRKYNPHSGWWRRGWDFLNPRPDVDLQWQFCTSGGNHLVFVLLVIAWRCYCVTQLKLYIFDKLSSTIFCCLSVSQASVTPDQNSTFSNKYRHKSPDSVPTNRVTHSILGLVLFISFPFTQFCCTKYFFVARLIHHK